MDMPTPQAAGRATAADPDFTNASSPAHGPTGLAPAPATIPELVPPYLGPAVGGRVTFTSSPTIGELVTALAAAQLEFGLVERTETATVTSRREGARSYSYDYAGLAGVLRAVRNALAKNGIAILQPPLVGQHSVTVTTLLAHTSGEWIRNELMLPLDATDPQAVGSAITYARRYGLMALLGVAPEDDDDAAAAMPRRDVRPGQGPVAMPTRVERTSPPPAASVPAQSGPPVAQTPAASPAAASPAPVPDPITIVAIEKLLTKSAKPVPYWRVVFSHGVRAFTFSTTDGPKLERGHDQGLRYSDVLTHTKDGHAYIDEFIPLREDGVR